MFKVSNKDNSVDMKHSKPSFVKVKKISLLKKHFFERLAAKEKLAMT